MLIQHLFTLSLGKNSLARSYLNGEFYDNSFTEIEKSFICESSIPISKLSIDDIDYVKSQRQVFETFIAGEETKDNIFILNHSEYMSYSDLIKQSSYECWLRGPTDFIESKAYGVTLYYAPCVSKSEKNGLTNRKHVNDKKRLRSAIWINISD